MIGDQQTLLPRYVLDKDAGGLFEKNSWFTYYSQSHLSLTTLDVYAIKSQNKFFKLQIVEFYRDNNNEKLGYYTLRVDRGNGLELLDVDASACGHPQSNPNYWPCQGTPKNRFAYVNLETFEIRYLSDQEAIDDLNWHIAFKADEIKLNSGKSGPADVRGAVLSKDLSYTTGDDQERFNLLFNTLSGDKDLSRFERTYSYTSVNFFGPDGFDKVIYEDQWFSENSSGQRSSKPNNWWLIKNFDETSYVKFRVKAIAETNINGVTESDITVSIHVQDIGQNRFSLESTDLTLKVSSDKRAINCIDFNGGPKVIGCSKSLGWDIRLINNKGAWSIQTRKGAQGPINTNDIINISSGI